MIEKPKKINVRRTLSAPLLSLICYIAMATINLIDAQTLASKDNIYLSVIVLQMIIFLIPGIIYCKLRNITTLKSLQVEPLSIKKVLFSIFSFIALLTGAALIKLLLYQFGYYSTTYTLYSNYIPSDMADFKNILYILLALAILPAITEEFIFRDIILLEYKRAGCGNISTVLMSSLLFAMLHFNLAQLPVYFFGGVIFATVLLVTDSILAAILVHFLNNAFSLFFETTLLRIISQADSVIFVLFSFGVIFVLFVILAMHMAEKIIKDKAMSGLDTQTHKLNSKEKNERNDRLLEAIISPTFILCIVTFFIITFAIK